MDSELRRFYDDAKKNLKLLPELRRACPKDCSYAEEMRFCAEWLRSKGYYVTEEEFAKRNWKTERQDNLVITFIQYLLLGVLISILTLGIFPGLMKGGVGVFMAATGSGMILQALRHGFSMQRYREMEEYHSRTEENVKPLPYLPVLGAMAVTGLCIGFCVTSAAAFVLHKEVDIGKYSYLLSEQNTVTITRWWGKEAAPEIPSKLGPFPVTEIGPAAFARRSCLTEVRIPDTVETIGPAAFAYCENLTDVELPDSVTLVSLEAFYMCRNLERAVVPASVTTIGPLAFFGNITTVMVVEKDSFAEQYAKENHISCTYMDAREGEQNGEV